MPSLLVPALIGPLVGLADKAPEPDDVVAGPWGALMFVALILATALLCWSFVRQLRRTREAQQRGVFGEPDAAARPDATAGGPERRG